MSLKVLIFPLSLAIAVAVAIFFIKPAFSELMSIRGTINEKKVKLENLKNQTQKLKSVQAKWETLTEEKMLVASAFPDEANVDSYVSEMTSKASRSGILLSDIQMNDKSKTASSPESASSYICQANQAGKTIQVADEAGAAGMSELDGSAGLSSSCLKTVGVSLKATGSWEQLLDFFKYLEDMNRITNVESVLLSTGGAPQGEPASDLLTADITGSAFFKERIENGNSILAGSVLSQGDFNRQAMERLKEAIYSPYDAPVMAPSAERNIFK